MVPRKAVELKEGLELQVTDGPNDWNLWLSFRRTIREVVFEINEYIWIPPFADPRSFLDGRIFSLWRSPSADGRFPDNWIIEGLGDKGSTWFTFRGNYNPTTRKGTITILKVNQRSL